MATDQNRSKGLAKNQAPPSRDEGGQPLRFLPRGEDLVVGLDIGGTKWTAHVQLQKHGKTTHHSLEDKGLPSFTLSLMDGKGASWQGQWRNDAETDAESWEDALRAMLGAHSPDPAAPGTFSISLETKGQDKTKASLKISRVLAKDRKVFFELSLSAANSEVECTRAYLEALVQQVSRLRAETNELQTSLCKARLETEQAVDQCAALATSQQQEKRSIFQREYVLANRKRRKVWQLKNPDYD